MHFFKNIIKIILQILSLSWFINIYDEIYRSWIRNLDGSIGIRKRYKYYKKRLKYLGSNVLIDTGVYINGAQYITIGKNSHIDKNSIIVGCSAGIDLSKRVIKYKQNESDLISIGEVKIGEECHISQNTMIYGYGGVYIGDNCVMSAGSKIYSLTSIAINPKDVTEIISIVPYDGISPTLIGKVIFENNVWIGLNVIISPGITLGKDSFVRSNSIVLKSFEKNSYIAGDPAVFLHPRFMAKDYL